MSKHTPGPWAIEDRGYKFIVYKPGDGYVTRDVCRLDSSTMAAFNQAANARLIAAAPELLAALQVMLRDYTAVHDIGDVEMQPAIYQARAAIAKATGEKQ